MRVFFSAVVYDRVVCVFFLKFAKISQVYQRKEFPPPNLQTAASFKGESPNVKWGDTCHTLSSCAWVSGALCSFGGTASITFLQIHFSVCLYISLEFPEILPFNADFFVNSKKSSCRFLSHDVDPGSEIRDCFVFFPLFKPVCSNPSFAICILLPRISIFLLLESGLRHF